MAAGSALGLGRVGMLDHHPMRVWNIWRRPFLMQ